MTTEQNKLILKFIPQQKKHNKTLDEEITHNNNLWAISLQYQTNKENIKVLLRILLVMEIKLYYKYIKQLFLTHHMRLRSI